MDWREGDKPEAECRAWLAAWLVSRDGMEGDFFYEGPGGGQTSHVVPENAVGVRLRWWKAVPPGEQDNEAQRGRTNLSRPFYFDDYAGPEVALSALAISP
jgi:hypothetical protein